MARQVIFYFLDANANFTKIARLNKKQRQFIKEVVNSKAFGFSKLNLITPSIQAEVSEYMLSFGHYL